MSYPHSVCHANQRVPLLAAHDSYYVTVSDQKKLVEVDRRTVEVSGSVDLPGSPDALTYFPKTGIVYVDHDDGEDLWVIDPVAFAKEGVAYIAELKAL